MVAWATLAPVFLGGAALLGAADAAVQVVKHDHCIVGAGPGGIQLGAMMENAGRDYVILEKGPRAASFYSYFPRHRKLISINKRRTGKGNKEFNMRHDWNSLLSPKINGTIEDEGSPVMPDYSRKFFPHCDEFLEYIDAFEAYHNVQVQYNTMVTEISKPDGPNGKSFTINTMPTTPPEDCKADDDQQCIPEHADTTEYHCGNVVVATSLGRPHIPNVPGIELTEGYETLSNDADDFHNQTVMILGLGNSAFETGEFISQEGGAYVHMIGRNKGGLRLAYATHYVGDLRAVNVHITDTFLLKSLDTIDVGFDLEKGEFTKNEETGKIHLNFPHQKDINYNYREGYDRVIRALGWRFEDSIFADDIKPTTDEIGKYPLMTDNFESANVPGLYFAGTVMHGNDFRRSAGGFIHGFRYLVKSMFHQLELKYHKEQLPALKIGKSEGDIASAFWERIQMSSGLYQMYGEYGLMDVITANPRSQSAYYFEELSHRGFLKQRGTAGSHYFTFHFDYGHGGFGGYANNDVATLHPGRGHFSQYLHPIIRYYQAEEGNPFRPLELKAEFHLMEDFHATWNVEEIHYQPLHDFIVRCMKRDFRSQDDFLSEVYLQHKANLTSSTPRTETVLVEDAFYGHFSYEPKDLLP